MQLTGIIEKADVDVKIDVQRGRWSPAKEAEKEKEARTKEKVLLTSGCFEMASHLFFPLLRGMLRGHLGKERENLLKCSHHAKDEHEVRVRIYENFCCESV
jgi:hypothetical protein